jgi:hypothetical protein
MGEVAIGNQSGIAGRTCGALGEAGQRQSGQEHPRSGHHSRTAKGESMMFLTSDDIVASGRIILHAESGDRPTTLAGSLL